MGGLSWARLRQLDTRNFHWPLLLSARGKRFPRDELGVERRLAQIRDRRRLLERSRAGSRALEGGWRFLADAGSCWVDASLPSSSDSYGMDARAATGGDEVPSAPGDSSQCRQRAALGGPGTPRGRPADGVGVYGDVDAEREGDFEGTGAEDLEHRGDFADAAYEDLRRQYLVAKRRFWRFAGRPPRRRRLREDKGEGKGKGFDPRPKKEALPRTADAARARSPAAAARRAGLSIPTPWPAARGDRRPRLGCASSAPLAPMANASSAAGATLTDA